MRPVFILVALTARRLMRLDVLDVLWYKYGHLHDNPLHSSGGEYIILEDIVVIILPNTPSGWSVLANGKCPLEDYIKLNCSLTIWVLVGPVLTTGKCFAIKGFTLVRLKALSLSYFIFD